MQAPKKKDRRTQEEMVLRDLLEDCVRGALGSRLSKERRTACIGEGTDTGEEHRGAVFSGNLVLKWSP
ncbi:unnamed protein product [Acanthoscelides obtectus]|uniref:Uncharacterized protein n=1 Tax=Acanthoscelides obtectus TaxID=200917 RepID=A0A9P0QGC5_ACAOB|nr:unnamed protein product [Acanthoscelides obtectus]CAK1689430.1 hypothetical protein AOBTE_LOCUS37256 [Acanthoscelides obtectus]